MRESFIQRQMWRFRRLLLQRVHLQWQEDCCLKPGETLYIFIWVKFLRTYKAWKLCHIFRCFCHHFQQFRGMESQEMKYVFSCPDCVWDSSIPSRYYLPLSLSTYKDLLLFDIQSDPRALWPLRHLIRVMRRHYLTNKKTKTTTTTKTNTFRKHLQRAPLETYDLWDTDYISDNWEQQSQHSE